MIDFTRQSAVNISPAVGRVLTPFPILHACVWRWLRAFPPRGLCAHTLPELHMCESGDVLGGGGRVRVLGKFFVDWHGSSTNYINLWFHLLYLWQELSQLDVCFSMFTIFNVQMFKLHADKSINHSPTHFALVLCPSKNGVNDQWNVSWIYFSGFINF